MNKSNRVDLLSPMNKPETSSMTTVNILGRLRIATEQVRKVRSTLATDGKWSLLVVLFDTDQGSIGSRRDLSSFSLSLYVGLTNQVDELDKVGKELDGRWTVGRVSSTRITPADGKQKQRCRLTKDPQNSFKFLPNRLYKLSISTLIFCFCLLKCYLILLFFPHEWYAST